MEIFALPASHSVDTRSPITPDSAKKLIDLGNRLTTLQGVGTASGYTDDAYSNVGVSFVESEQVGLQSAEIVLGVALPTSETVAQMQKGARFIGRVEPFDNMAVIQAAAEAGIELISMEMMPRTTIAQKMDVISSQANLAGYYAMIVAAERSPKIMPMMMTPAGTIAPARIFVVGVGVAGLQAIATARRLGTRVQAFDTRPVVEEQVKSLGAKFVKIDLGDTGQTDQGYAKALTDEQLALQRQGMAKVCAQSDVVITTAKLFGRKAPTIITEEMVAAMQPGSIIVDLAAETGGNVVGTVCDNEVVTANGVTIIGIGKLENHVPHHASQVYAANLFNFIEHFWDAEANQLQLDSSDEIVQGVVLTRDGAIVHDRFH